MKKVWVNISISVMEIEGSHVVVAVPWVHQPAVFLNLNLSVYAGETLSTRIVLPGFSGSGQALVEYKVCWHCDS